MMVLKRQGVCWVLAYALVLTPSLSEAKKASRTLKPGDEVLMYAPSDESYGLPLGVYTVGRVERYNRITALDYEDKPQIQHYVRAVDSLITPFGHKIEIGDLVLVSDFRRHADTHQIVGLGENGGILYQFRNREDRWEVAYTETFSAVVSFWRSPQGEIIRAGDTVMVEGGLQTVEAVSENGTVLTSSRTNMKTVTELTGPQHYELANRAAPSPRKRRTCVRSVQGS
ncbi:hypothetical protein K2X33_11780 [bacterium]|nr:hypothetical protein [bacterium]